MDRLGEALARLEEAVTRLEAALAGAPALSGEERRELAGEIGRHVDAALARIGEALGAHAQGGGE
ncbi:MAG: hypothetical protein ACREE4_15285 [Stellaceae bacterium]